jgi:hypothetical protein
LGYPYSNIQADDAYASQVGIRTAHCILHGEHDEECLGCQNAKAVQDERRSRLGEHLLYELWSTEDLLDHLWGEWRADGASYLKEMHDWLETDGRAFEEIAHEHAYHYSNPR